MTSLCSRADLLSTGTSSARWGEIALPNEHVVAVREQWIVWTWHGVEGSMEPKERGQGGGGRGG
jgi:hypothetical protein